jgi:FkbM family methyltransferase
MDIERINDFWVPSNDVHIEDWKAKTGSFTQNKCLEKFKTHCKVCEIKLKTVLDIGAWCGTWSHAMHEYAEHIVAFEPDPLHVKCLKLNLKRITNCTIRNEAVGDKEGLVSLTNDDFTQAKRIADTPGQLKMITLDQLEYDNVEMIKIDVEGYEMNVLEGAKKLLASPNLKFLMIELNNNTKKYGSSNLEIEKYLDKMGFEIMIKVWPDVVWRKKGKRK